MSSNRQSQSRRSFLQQAGVSGLALIIGTAWPIKGQPRGPIKAGTHTADGSSELMSWISIEPSGRVTIFNHRSEMGQGTWQAIPQIVAEELEVDMKDVVVKYVAANPKNMVPNRRRVAFLCVAGTLIYYVPAPQPVKYLLWPRQLSGMLTLANV